MECERKSRHLGVELRSHLIGTQKKRGFFLYKKAIPERAIAEGNACKNRKGARVIRAPHDLAKRSFAG
ncbi:MAG: hypothetical protein IKO42_01215 [Opitutales bacterium]|nr:hypothetical protein [Opitutales bacterium]